MRVSSGIVWAVVIAGTVGLLAAALHVERWIGGGHPPRLVFDVRLPDDAPRDERQRVAEVVVSRLRGRHAELGRAAASHLIVSVDGDAADVEATRVLLTRTGRLELFEVASDTPTARAWFVAAHDQALGADVEGVPESWSNERTGEPFVDHFLRAPTAEALDAAIARAGPPAAGLRVLYGDVLPSGGDGRQEPYVRTYLVVDQPELDGRAIEKANVTYDQNTMRPEVMIHFDREGARRFGDLTARIIGHKLAIVLDGRVTSAPIVQSAIRGGVCTITMGGGDRADAEREARDLANVLRAGAALPEGMTASLLSSTPAVDGLGALPHVGLALLAGLLAFLAAPWLARRLTVGAAAPLTPGTRGLSRVALAAALTLGLPIALVVLGPRLTLPFVNPGVYAGMGLASLGVRPPTLHVFALGLTSVLSGYWLAELIAVLVPAWRRRRSGSAGERAPVERLARVLALVFAAVQAWLYVRYLAELRSFGARALLDDSAALRAVITLTLIAGVALQLLLADVITRHGLCNGVVALIGVGLLHNLYETFARAPALHAPDGRLALAATLAVLAVLALIVSALRDGSPDRRRLPWAGVVPVAVLGIAGGLALLLLQLITLGDGVAGARKLDVLLAPPTWLAIGAPFVAAIVLVRLRGPGALAASRVGLAITLGFVAALVLVRAVAAGAVQVEGWLVPVPIILGLVVDGVGAARARLGMIAPVAVLAVHDVDRADRAAGALAAAGLPASDENLRLRALLRGLGGFAPIVIRVERTDGERAADAIAEAETERDPHVAAFAG
jgi:hypothetical protein